MIAASLVLTCRFAMDVRAQSSPPQPTSPSSGKFGIAASSGSARESEIILPSVTVSGAPRSYQVISIPLPDALSQSPEVEVVIVPRGDFAILGPRARTLNARAGQRRVGITVGIPANALAGRLVAAEAHFIANGSPTLVVPIEIDVSLVRNVAVRPSATPLNAQAGSDVILAFDIANAGNAIEGVSTELPLPTGWSTRETHQTLLAIAPAEIVHRRVRLKVPALSSTGSSFVHVELLAGKETVASQTITIEVFNSRSIGGQ